jgi:drug/metabolite transporter (DMT)-like permease
MFMQTITAAKPPVLKLIAAFAAVYIIWGSTYLGVRFASESIPPLLMASVRFLVSGTILYIVARTKGAAAPKPIHWKSSVITGFFLLLLGNGMMAWSLKFVSSSLAAILVATEPFWLVLVAWLLFGKGKPKIKEVLGLAIGFVGIMILISTKNQAGNTDTNPIGVVMVMVSAIAWAIGSMYATKAVNTDSAILTVAMQMLAGGVMLVMAGTLAGEWKLLHFDAVTAKSLLALAYLTFFGSLVAFTAYSWLLGKVSPSLASTYAFVNPVVAIFLGWSLGGEAISVAMLLASGIIITSVILITQAKHK